MIVLVLKRFGLEVPQLLLNLIFVHLLMKIKQVEIVLNPAYVTTKKIIAEL